MQVLFAWDSHGSPDRAMAERLVEYSADPEERAAALNAATAAWEQREITDQRLDRLAPKWPVRRQPGVDRSILRLAVWEMSNTDTPPKVVIDEAIELAKAFSTQQSAAFVNGVLDAVRKENLELTGQ